MSSISSSTVILACVVFLFQISCARHYRAQGIVLSVDRPNRTVTISHRAIPGYMEAMAMPFRAEQSQDLARLTPGSRIGFQLKVTRQAATIRHIRVEQIATADITLPKPEGQVSIGEAVPDFALTAEDGRAVALSGFRGKLVVVDFIYTRCPLPNV